MMTTKTCENNISPDLYHERDGQMYTPVQWLALEVHRGPETVTQWSTCPTCRANYAHCHAKQISCSSQYPAILCINIKYKCLSY